MHNLPGGKKNARASLQYLGTWLSDVARKRGDRRDVAGKRFSRKSAVGCFRKRVKSGAQTIAEEGTNKGAAAAAYGAWIRYCASG